MGSSSCHTSLGSASKNWSAPMTISWVSAPTACATSRAHVSSLNARSLNATEKVCSGRSIIRAMRAAIALLSRPPERNMPSGTSDINRSRTDSSSSARKRDTHSRPVGAGVAAAAPMGTSQVPSRGDASLLVHEQVSGQQLVYAFEERLLTREITGSEQLRKTALVRLRLNETTRENRLDLGAEDEPIVADGPVERLDPQSIAREQQPPAGGVPDGEREHAAEAVNTVVPPLLVRVDNRLGIAAGVITVSGGLELRAQVGVVVDLAVEHDLDRAVFVARAAAILTRDRRCSADGARARRMRRTRRLLRRGRDGRSRRACEAAVRAPHHAVRRWSQSRRCRTC